MKYGKYWARPEDWRKNSPDLYDEIITKGKEIGRQEGDRWGIQMVFDINGVAFSFKTVSSVRGSGGRTGIEWGYISAASSEDLEKFLVEFSLEKRGTVVKNE